MISPRNPSRQPAPFPARPAPGRRYRAPLAAHSSPKVHPWTPSRSRKSFSRAPLTREQAKALDEARERLHRFDGMPGSLRHGAEFLDCLILSPVLFGLLLAQRGVRALVRNILRASQRRETAPSPSLRGAPLKEDIDSVWAETPRTILSALRLGSRLLDLEPTVDNSRVWKEDPLTGKREVVFRHAGIKGWLKTHCPGVQYNTAMRYKKLASRLRTVCGVAGHIPFEWLLPDAAVPAEGLDARTLSAVETGRGELAKILAGAKSLRGLDRVVEERMNLTGLPRKGREISVIPHEKEVPGEEAEGEEMAREGEGNSVISQENTEAGGEGGGKERAREEGGCAGKTKPGTGKRTGRKRETAQGRKRGRPKKGHTARAGAAETRKERLLSALRQMGMRPEGRLLWVHFRHLLSRAAGGDTPHAGDDLPTIGKNA